MLDGDGPDGAAVQKPVASYGPVAFGQGLNGKTNEVHLVELGKLVLSLFDTDPDPGNSRCFLDALEHGVQDGTGEVSLGVRQAGWVIGACCLDKREVSISLKVFDVHGPLPARSRLNEVPSQIPNQVHPLVN
jgi:hypothetical protein